MKIVKLTPADWKKFKKIRLEALKNDSLAFGTYYEEAVERSDDEWKEPLKKPRSYIFAAKEKDKLIGLVAAYQEEGKKCLHVAYIWGVYVNKEHRGKGIAKKLMKKLIEELKKNGFIKAKLNVTTIQTVAFNLYKSLGFRPVGILHKEMKIYGKYYDEYLMEKML